MSNKAIKDSINKELSALQIYHPSIPLQEIFSIVERNSDSMVVQEDGTRWSGFLCGDDSHATFEIAGFKFALRVMWHRMNSGNYEITAYVS